MKRMLKLIDEDADFLAEKVEELHFMKRPNLVTVVEEFYRMYCSLAERYDHVMGELKKNIPSDLQSRGYGVSDVGLEPLLSVPSPDMRPAHTNSGPCAAGFDFFPGSDGSGSDLNSKEGDEYSSLDFESESDDSSQRNGEEQVSQRRIIELEAELQKMKEELRLQQEENPKGFKKCDHEEELRVAKENAERSKEEITRLKIELDKYESLGGMSSSHSPRSAEINKAQDTLKLSSLEVCAAVKDPLPYALRVAEANTNEARLEARQAKGNDGRPEVIIDAAGVVQSGGGTVNNMPKLSLIEWNSSVHTYERDDSIDGSQVDIASRVELQLPTPRRIFKMNKLKTRRIGRRWSPLEENTLRAGVELYGKGNWKVILTADPDIFEGRSAVDLKDKWRNLIEREEKLRNVAAATEKDFVGR